ncbi:MAG: hypothetical protein U0903_19560 [Planctomycetales bacterium]
MSAANFGISAGQVFHADSHSAVGPIARQSGGVQLPAVHHEALTSQEIRSLNWMQRLLLRLNGVFANSSELEW